MVKKLIALIVIIPFTFFNCISTHVEEVLPVKKIPLGKPSSIAVLGVITNSNKWIEFDVKPGRIVLTSIEGEVTEGPGKTIKRISIPLNEVKRVWLRRSRSIQNKVLLPIIGFLGSIVAGIILGVMTFGDPFCPFIYSFDGNAYTMDAEPFAGAIGPGFKRTEWKELPSLVEINHQYCLLAVNEVDAADYLDLVQLLAVDHPRGVIIIPGLSGAIHTIIEPMAPTKAYNQGGNDLLPYVVNNDEIYWPSDDENQELTDAEELKTELILEFPRPKGAREVKIVFKGCNSFWGAGVLTRRLAMYGNNARAMLEELTREESLSLQLRVETADGWKTAARMAGGSPLAPGIHVYPVDLSGVTGDIFRIKLTPPAASWMIDYIAVDYSKDLPVKVTALQAVKTSGTVGNDDKVKKLLAVQDDCYLELSPQGASVGLIFDSPPHCPGMERTIILEASGYYTISPNSQ